VTGLLAASYAFMGILVVSILVLSILFLVLGGKILSVVRQSLTVESAVTYRVTLIAVSCALSMLASIAVMVSYFALADASSVLSFAANLTLSIMRDLFQLVFLVGTVLAFLIHSLHAASDVGKSSERSMEKGSVMGANAEDIIMELTEKGQTV